GALRGSVRRHARTHGPAPFGLPGRRVGEHAMKDFLAFGSLGIIQGFTYAIVAFGMVLIDRGSRTVNFAQPLMGLFAAYTCWYFTGTPNARTLGVGLGIESGPAVIKWLRYPLVLFPFDVGTRPRFAIAAFWSLVFIAFVGYRLERDIMELLKNSPSLVKLVATIALSTGFLGITALLFERTQRQATVGKALPVLIPASWKF